MLPLKSNADESDGCATCRLVFLRLPRDEHHLAKGKMGGQRPPGAELSLLSSVRWISHGARHNVLVQNRDKCHKWNGIEGQAYRKVTSEENWLKAILTLPLQSEKKKSLAAAPNKCLIRNLFFLWTVTLSSHHVEINSIVVSRARQAGLFWYCACDQR